MMQVAIVPIPETNGCTARLCIVRLITKLYFDEYGHLSSFQLESLEDMIRMI